MAVRRMVLLVTAAVVLSGCGSGGDADAPATAGAGTSLPATTTSGTSVAATAETAGPPKQPKKGPAPAAPEVVPLRTTEDVTRSAQQQAVLTGWQGVTVQELRSIEPRLVTDQQATLQKVRSSCAAFESGMFETKAIVLVRKKFSTAAFAVPEAMAQRIYQTILQTACYVMNES